MERAIKISQCSVKQNKFVCSLMNKPANITCRGIYDRLFLLSYNILCIWKSFFLNTPKLSRCMKFHILYGIFPSLV